MQRIVFDESLEVEDVVERWWWMTRKRERRRVSEN